MAELFILAITTCVMFMPREDRVTALSYCLAIQSVCMLSYATNYLSLLFLISSFLDLMLILIMCRLQSRISFFLIPACVASIAIQFLGWSEFKTGGDMSFYNSLVIAYQCYIFALFLLRIAFNHAGNNSDNSNILSDDSDKSSRMGRLSA